MSPVPSHRVGSLRVHVVPALSDNYSYLLEFDGGLAVVDPSDAERVLDVCRQLRRTPTLILCTHGHADHVGGNVALKKATGCRVMGPEGARIPGLDDTLADGSEILLGTSRLRVLATPGHTRSDLTLCLDGAIFSGDTLFVSGCGRLFECDAATMYGSLQKLAGLPDNTRVFCGHEYAEENLDFALSVLPDDPAFLARRAEIRRLRGGGEPSVPSTLGQEKAANPFLRAHDPAIAAALRMAGAKPVDVFAELRRRRNHF